jgi:D-tyrosyl-tRNA(Tyr) deacylase
MRAIIQKCSRAEVRIEGDVKGKIGKGFMILLGIEEADSEEDISWLSGKISKMRIFEDEAGKMNRSIKDVEGRILMVSQFTLHASTKKGNRPSFIKAARPETAIPLYEKMKNSLEADTGTTVETGEFGAFMEVDLVNDGPVTIYMDSKVKE